MNKTTTISVQTDDGFNVMINSCCENCIYHNDDIPTALNPICAHCTRVKFIKIDRFTERRSNE